MFLDICKKWNQLPLAGPGARRNLVRVDGHRCDRRSQDLGEKKEYWLWQLAAENHRAMCIETEEHSWEGTAIHSIISSKEMSKRKKIHRKARRTKDNNRRVGNSYKCWHFSLMWCLEWNLSVDQLPEKPHRDCMKYSLSHSAVREVLWQSCSHKHVPNYCQLVDWAACWRCWLCVFWQLSSAGALQPFQLAFLDLLRNYVFWLNHTGFQQVTLYFQYAVLTIRKVIQELSKGVGMKVKVSDTKRQEPNC